MLNTIHVMDPFKLSTSNIDPGMWLKPTRWIGKGLINAVTGDVGPSTQVTGNPTNQELGEAYW